MKKIITAISIAMMLAGITAYADTAVEQCTYDRDTKIAVVSGVSDSGEVTLSVKNGDGVYFETQQSADSGSFKFEFQLQGAARAEYSVIVGAMNADPVNTALIYYGSEVDAVFAKLNEYAAADNSAEFQKVLTDSLEILDLHLSQEELSAIPYMSSVIMAQAPFGKVNELKSAFDTAKYLYDLSAITDNSVLNSVIKSNKERYAEKYPIIYEVYADFSEANQEEICGMIISAVNHNVVTEEKFNDIFAVQTMKKALNSAEGWSAARDIVGKTKTEIGINAAKLSDKSSVYIKMINSDYSAMSDFNSVYTKAVSDAAADDKKGSSGGGGGGGSSKGSSIGASFVPKSPVSESGSEKIKFKDTDGVIWAKEAIESLAEAKIVSGRDEETFDPNAPVLREEFVKMIVLTFQMSMDSPKPSFSDVADGAWYAEYVSAAENAGIVSGVENNLFGIGRNITRQDLVTLIYRAMQKNNLVNQTSDSSDARELFADDSSVSDYARDGIYCLKDLKIINGRENGCFDPQANASRAEAAKILYSVRNMKIADDYVKEK